MDAEKGKSWNGLAVALVLTIILPVLYFLSAGPMVVLIENEVVSQNAMIVYMPFMILGEFSESFSELSDKYIDLWSNVS